MLKNKTFHQLTLVAASCVFATGAFCAPAPAQQTQQPAEDTTDYSPMITQQYDGQMVVIEDAQRSFVSSEAQYTDGTANANDETKASATFANNEERHTKVVADVEAYNQRVDDMKTRYDGLKGGGATNADFNEMSQLMNELNHDGNTLRAEYSELAVQATAAGTQK